MTKHYRAVVFDWDGTVMNSTYTITESIRNACADLNLPVPSVEQASWVIGLSLESALYHAVPTLTADQVPAFIERYRAHFMQFDRDIPLFDGMRQLLDELKEQGVLLAVATGKSRLGLNRVLDAHGMLDYFHMTRCADEALGKPNPRMLHDIMFELSVQEHSVVMVGDTSHDVLMAHNAGVDSIAVTYGAHKLADLQDAAPTVIVNDVPTLRSHLLAAIPAAVNE